MLTYSWWCAASSPLQQYGSCESQYDWIRVAWGQVKPAGRASNWMGRGEVLSDIAVALCG